METRRLSILGKVGVACAALLLSGCTDLTARVSGTVSLDGKPMKLSSTRSGMVVFSPVLGGATCSGMIDETGQYRVTTGGATALAPGEYLVSVRVSELIAASNEDEAPTGKPILPAVYGDPMTSGLSLVVKKGPNQFDIDLDSSAGPTVIVPVEPAETPEEEAGEEEAGEEEEDEKEQVKKPEAVETAPGEEAVTPPQDPPVTDQQPAEAAADSVEASDQSPDTKPKGDGDAS